MEVLDHLKADEIVTALSASQDLAAYVQPSMYSMIAWEWNTLPGARILHLLQTVLLCPVLISNIQHVSNLSSPQYVRIEEWKKDPRDGQDESLWSQDLESFSNVVEQSQSLVNKAQIAWANSWTPRNGMKHSAWVIPMLIQLFFSLNYTIFNLFAWTTPLSGNQGSEVYAQSCQNPRLTTVSCSPF